MLQQQATHAPGSNDGNLLTLQRDQLIQATGLAQFQLRQLHSSRTD